VEYKLARAVSSKHDVSRIHVRQDRRIAWPGVLEGKHPFDGREISVRDNVAFNLQAGLGVDVRQPSLSMRPVRSLLALPAVPRPDEFSGLTPTIDKRERRVGIGMGEHLACPSACLGHLLVGRRLSVTHAPCAGPGFTYGMIVLEKQRGRYSKQEDDTHMSPFLRSSWFLAPATQCLPPPGIVSKS